MGHVDHGKTSLLDYIRKSKVAEKEAGGITQHIGASSIDMPQGRIVFLDTPGHEAFTAMRGRGAQVTDIVVLVVAADDGVMPQTSEAINHSKAAGAPVIVAINKIDLPDSNLDAIKQRLAEAGLMSEEWGGDTMLVNCSAKTGEGVDELLESILLQAEMLELKANPKQLAEGFVIESRMDKGKGPICTVLIQEGTLEVGKPLICGNYSGKVRVMIDDKGKNIKKAGPGTPVEVVGLSGVPMPGDKLLGVEDDKKARMVSQHRKEIQRQSDRTAPVKASLEDLLEMAKEGEKPKVNLIIKADTNGSIEGVKEVLNKVFGDEADQEIIHTGVGGITESDVLLASASNATIIGFMVRPESKAMKLAERDEVEIKLYQIIYDLGKDMEAKLKGLFKPVIKERVLGHVEVREIFNVPRVGTVAGSYVVDGLVNRNSKARLLRDQVVVYEGKVSTLKRFKDEAREVKAGFECGLTLENYQDIKPGDVIETFILEEVPVK
jgi:translation initiation factor IF-2